MTYAYIKGFQGDTLSNKSVITMVSIFQEVGHKRMVKTPKFPYGKEQVYPGDNFNYHLIPFTKEHYQLILVKYGIPVGQTKKKSLSDLIKKL